MGLDLECERRGGRDEIGEGVRGWLCRIFKNLGFFDLEGSGELLEVLGE